MHIQRPIIVSSSISSVGSTDVSCVVGSSEVVCIGGSQTNGVAAAQLCTHPSGLKMYSRVSGCELDEDLAGGDEHTLAGWDRVGCIVCGHQDTSGINARIDLKQTGGTSSTCPVREGNIDSHQVCCIDEPLQCSTGWDGTI